MKRECAIDETAKRTACVGLADGAAEALGGGFVAAAGIGTRTRRLPVLTDRKASRYARPIEQRERHNDSHSLHTQNKIESYDEA